MKLKNKIFILLIIVLIINIFCVLKTINIEKQEEIKLEPKLQINKIIIVGDSRMELINNKKEKINIPTNIEFIALSGAKISWVYKKAIPKLYKLIDKDSNYKYSVVFNMGVNDLDSNTDASLLASEYFELYKRLAKQNKDVSFYFLSVNPVDDDILRKNLPSQKRTNARIKEFNDYFIYKISKENIENVRYCDSYNTVTFELPDGLHYNTKTDKAIINYIIKECSDNNFNYNYYK